MNKPKITIGILNRNGIEYLKKTIPAILKLDYLNKEIIIVDNGSSDKSISYLHRFPKIKVIENKDNRGYGAGKNQIVENSNGKYILMIDNDILIKDKNILNELLSFYELNKDIAFLSIPTLDTNKELTQVYGLSYTSPVKFVSINQIIKNPPYQVGSTTGQNLFFSKGIWEKLGGIDKIYPFNIDDYDLGARTYNLGYTNWIYSKSFAIHLGVGRSNIDNWCWKNQFYLAGFFRMMIKNYNKKNLIIFTIPTVLWISFKSLRKFFEEKDMKILNSYFKSVYYLFRDFQDTLNQRKIIQSNRVVKEDLFLNIKPPKFD
jgi:GT2 family glycosyltransferase